VSDTSTLQSFAASFRGFAEGAPRRWLRLEGFALLTGSLIAFAYTMQSWWLLLLLMLAPDAFALGYVRGSRVGARLYNLAHVTLIPAVLIGLGEWLHRPPVLALGLIWLAHVGVDRLLGYGLKYDDSFQHTHLGWIGQSGKGSKELSPQSAKCQLAEDPTKDPTN
jgi:Domain of unknown function (DUF4260)